MSFTLTRANARPAVIGLGYVGLPLAVALGELMPTLGYDTSQARVDGIARGDDASGELTGEELAKATGLRVSSDAGELREANLYIIAVPTPVTRHKWPDLGALLAATRTVAACLKAGDVVVYESTVYPGATEEVCAPELAKLSGLALNRDFFVGYSPERINPGDRQRRLRNIVKVTSGSTPEAAAFIDALYRSIVPAGTYLAPSIRVAEAAKAIENTQRDVNIALVNELAQMFRLLGLDTEAVLRAAGTKWNFLPFWPGLVGGHCIGVDPYYLVHKAQEAGHHPELILAARRINEGMGRHVAADVVRTMATRGLGIVGARVLVLGLTFKEDCNDLRNTRVVEIVRELREYHAAVDVHDPRADPVESEREYGVELVATPAPASYDCVILAVAHREFRALGVEGVRAFLKPGGVVYDIKYVLPREATEGRL